MGNRRTHNRFLDFLSTYWKTLLIVGIPLALLPLPLVAGTDPAKCGYVILLMALYWMCDLLPLAITSLIPVALFPMMGIMDTGSTSMQYMKSTCMLVLVSK